MDSKGTLIHKFRFYIVLLLIGCVSGVLGTFLVLQFLPNQLDPFNNNSSTLTTDPTVIHDREYLGGKVENRASSVPPPGAGLERYAVSDDPLLDWIEIVSDQTVDLLQREHLIQIAMTAVESDGLHVLIQFLSEVDREWEELNQVVSTVVRVKASTSPQDTFEQALSLPLNDGGALILNEIVKVWSSINPETALATINALERNDLRVLLRDTLLDVWIVTDPAMVLENLEDFPERIQADLRHRAIVSLREHSPGDAITQILETTKEIDRYKLAIDLATDWALEDSNAALNWALSDPDFAEMRNYLVGNVILVIASEQPEKAMQIALTHTKQDKIEGEYDYDTMVVMQLATQNIDQALAMVSQVKESSKMPAYSTIGFSLLDGSEYQRAIDLGNDLSASDKSAYFEQLMGLWSVNEPQTLIEWIDRISLPEAKSSAARALIGKDWFRGDLLTAQQREFFKSLLTKQDAQYVREVYPDEERRRVTETE